ncbi:hypothetical protein RchiOBHm_Chr2g0159371 [Rosa chinensis]|uniref:Uncharacterized protein n=1 Tax=Rosa chinensis TaxID=74649 RepID=A0A2P6S275_ROSCH|nr:hypothetical protein RchiOBHm_Chr2g0159371 [Rosa chinensis]
MPRNSWLGTSDKKTFFLKVVHLCLLYLASKFQLHRSHFETCTPLEVEAVQEQACSGFLLEFPLLIYPNPSHLT